MRKRFLTFPLFLLAALIVTVSASAAAESRRMEIANRSDDNGAFSCDVKLSGGQMQGDVFAVLFAESGQMKRVSDYAAAETVQVALQDVAATDYVKILWTDENCMPLASPAVLRMTANNAAAYEKFAQDLAGLNAPETPVNPESSDPYALARLIVSAAALPDLSGYDVQTVSGPDNLYILQFKSSGEAERCEKYLKSSRSVRYAEPDFVILANGDMTADGAATSVPHSWGVKETGIGAYAESLLKREINRPVTVAVVDSGVDSSHPFLKNRLVSGYDFVDGDNVPQDGHGHGTHVAGTVVDCTPGMKVSVMPVRVLGDNARGTLLNIFLGIRYAADNGANVINLSLSLNYHSDMIEDAIRDAISKNVTVVVAAGNYNYDAAFYCPAHTEEAITVAAVESDLRRFELSNYGSAVDIAAPGADVESSVPGGEFLKMSGTSMAVPHVSAAAALLINELDLGQTPSQIAAAIRGAAKALRKDASDFEWQRYKGNNFLGAGFLDMRAFIQEPESQFYAHLYADGEMAFQTSRTPDPNKTLVQTYPVSASAGAGEYAAWHSRRAEIRSVTFVDSIRPDSTTLWFYGCENLTEIKSLENLDVSAVTDMSQMFARCGGLTTLDLSALNTGSVRNMRFLFFSCGKLAELDLTGWSTANVADMSDMFNGCAALKTVYASESFTTGGVSNGVGMFMGCTSLIGGSGTEYDSAHTDKERARMDGGTSAPGYFTDKNAPIPSNDIYAVLYGDGELVFQNNDRTESGRSVTDVYKVEGSYSHLSDAPWYGQGENITTVTFANKIQPDSTAFWFDWCVKLTEVRNIKNLDTANVTDMRYMFCCCSGLTALDVSRFDTANVTDMAGMFSGCSGLTALDVSRFDTANVTDTGYMFSDCSELTALDVSSFDTSNVTNMGYMFKGCSGLTALDVSSFDTANVTDMLSMFYGCNGLTTLDVSKFDTANVTDMGVMFDGCSGLTALNVSGFDTANVTDMSWMFYRCSNLKTIYASDKFTTASVTLSSAMFQGCTSLVGGAGTQYDDAHTGKEYARIDGGASAPGYFTDKNAPQPSNNIYAVLYADGELVFQNNNRTESGRSVTDVYKVEGSYSWDDHAPWYGQRNNIITVTFADKIQPDSTAHWFFYCERLAEIRNIKNLDTSNVTDMCAMFYDCDALKSLDVSTFDTSNVINMNSMFRGCRFLTSLDVGSFDTGNVTDMNAMFAGCGVASLDISNFDTSRVTDMSCMFWVCHDLKSLDINSFDTRNVTGMEHMFYGCESLKTIYASEQFTTNALRLFSSYMFKETPHNRAKKAADICQRKNVDFYPYRIRFMA